MVSGPAAFSRTRELACLRHDWQYDFFLKHIPRHLRRTEWVPEDIAVICCRYRRRVGRRCGENATCVA
jgi:hypothetical protein